MRWLVVLAGFTLACTKTNTGHERCGQLMPCPSGGRAYQFCATGASGGGRYLLGDGTELPCVDETACEAAVAQVESWCVTGMPPIFDLAVPPDGGFDSARPIDFAEAGDLAAPDLAVTACASSAACLDPQKPICDPGGFCRACVGAGDDTSCAAHGAGLHCRTSGANLGRCTACDTNAHCAATPTTPTCDALGACRKCEAHAECASTVCDLRPGGTTGQCLGESSVVYVEKRNTCTGENGSRALPWCEITTALNNLSGKSIVRVAPGTYARIDRATSVNAYLFGPGPSTPAAITAGTSGQAVNLYTAANIVIGFDGFDFQGNSDAVTGGSTVYLDGSGGNGSLTIRNSRIRGGLRGLRTLNCAVSVSETILAGTADQGASIEAGSKFSFENVVFVGCGVTGGQPAVVINDSALTSGSFRFNTLSGNGSGTNAGAILCHDATLIQASIVFGNSKSAGGSQLGGTSGCTLENVVTGTDTIGDVGKLPGAPVFRSASDPRLDLTPGASLTANQGCCIDKIAPATGLPTLDVEREKRPGATNWDVGADEASAP